MTTESEWRVVIIETRAVSAPAEYESARALRDRLRAANPGERYSVQHVTNPTTQELRAS